jgi:glycosyltransferase involved in cell wall biosynthesis
MCDLGIYITCSNEENLIVPCVTSVTKVFPDAVVIDLGSTDTTLDLLSKLDVKVLENGRMSGAEFTKMKTEMSALHDWVFWVDGDEIWPEDNLLLLRDRLSQYSKDLDAFRVAWRYLSVIGGAIYCSSPVVNGPKLYRASMFEFSRSWPREVLRPKTRGRTQAVSKASAQWCWHGKLLKRSCVDETARRKKRECYPDDFCKYHKEAKWEVISKMPFCDFGEEIFDIETDKRILS